MGERRGVNTYDNDDREENKKVENYDEPSPAREFDLRRLLAILNGNDLNGTLPQSVGNVSVHDDEEWRLSSRQLQVISKQTRLRAKDEIKKIKNES